MPYENNPVTISNLIASWPYGIDDKTYGAQHLRNIKKVLLGQFGFNAVISATEDEINALVGTTESLQGQLNTGPIEDLTSMVFVQAIAPDGWYVDACANDRVIRLMGAGANYGGSWTISGLVANPHTHHISITSTDATSEASSKGNPSSDKGYSINTHAHLAAGNTAQASPGITSDCAWRMQYVDSLICRKAIPSNDCPENMPGLCVGSDPIPPNLCAYNLLLETPKVFIADLFGGAVAISGDIAAVSAPNGSGSNGDVYIYQRQVDKTWLQIQKIACPTTDGYDGFGSSLSIDWDTLVIGYDQAKLGSTQSGVVYVYVKTGSLFVQQQILTITRGPYFFGHSVSIDGDTIAASATHGTPAVYVFTRSEDAWTEQQQITCEISECDGFGGCVRISGNTIAIATDTDIANTNAQGKVCVYVESGGVWSLQQTLSASDPQEDAAMGVALDISGDIIVAGAPYADPNGTTEDGASYVFQRTVNTWTQIQKLKPGITDETTEYMGGQISLDGIKLATNNGGAQNIGGHGSRVFAYTFNGSQFDSEVILTPTQDEQGNAPSNSDSNSRETVSVDGDTVIGGFQNYYDAVDDNIGSATIFDYCL